MKRKPRREPSHELPQVLETAIQDYQEWADKQMRSVQKKTAVSRPLYHYTDAAGLKGMISNQVFWFTDFRHLNDPTEMHHGMTLAIQSIDVGKNKKDQAGLLYSMLDDLFTFRNFSRVFSFFVACFTRRRDDLGQWRTYGDDGRGFAIGLSRRLFAIEARVGNDPTQNVFVSPVFYDDAVTKRRHTRPINEAVSIFQLAANYAHRHLKDHRIGVPFLRELALQVIASPLIWNCLTCKNTGYKVEDEVRLVVLGQKAKFRKYLRTRFRNGKRVPYIESHMPLQTRGSIVEIIIGPDAPKNAERYVKTVLKDAGIKFAIPIRRSKIPYRSFKSRSP
jgi:Protein of unknown function (DUF2971)